jgi:hypothetical protein
VGFAFTCSVPLDSTGASNAADYQVDAIVFKTVRKRRSQCSSPSGLQRATIR